MKNSAHLSLLWRSGFLALIFCCATAKADIDGDGIADDVDPYPSDAANVPVERNATAWRILEIYVATLNRAVDAEGLDYWAIEVATRPEWTPLTVAQSFFSQPEVQERYPESLSFGQLIEALYQNVLGRQPDREGFDYWLGELTTGRITRDQMVIALINGLWSNPVAYQNGDVARFRNRVLISDAFARAQRQEGLLFSALSQAQREEFLSFADRLLEDVDQSTANTQRALSGLDTTGLFEDGDNLLDPDIADIAADMTPIVLADPVYPRRALSRGITGYCVVTFTVSISGTVSNVAPFDCQPAGVFDRAATNAALDLRYQPVVIDGVPVEIPGVSYRFVFTLDEAGEDEAPVPSVSLPADLEEKYAQSCAVCHGLGVAGAPVTGDAAAWAPRLAKGMDALIDSTVNGIGAMPPMGMCFICTDSDYEALINFMATDGAAPAISRSR